MSSHRRLLLFVFVCACFSLLVFLIPWIPFPMMTGQATSGVDTKPDKDQPFVVVLGIAQDAGYPQAGCHNACCAPAWRDHAKRRYPCCIAVVDPQSKQRWIVDCTPSFPDQLYDLDRIAPVEKLPGINGIFLTHAHMGHYTGLMHLGREAMGASKIPVHAMPRMARFLSGNAPWSQLVDLKNIEIRSLKVGEAVTLSKNLSITPMTVPHRGEFSETVAFVVNGPKRSLLYLPDIDRWEQWPLKVENVVAKVDRAYLDGTFFSGDELPGRDMSKIPHPTIQDSMARFSELPPKERDKIHFLHLNHTNPALQDKSAATNAIKRGGFHVAGQFAVFGL